MAAVVLKMQPGVQMPSGMMVMPLWVIYLVQPLIWMWVLVVGALPAAALRPGLSCACWHLPHAHAQHRLPVGAALDPAAAGERADAYGGAQRPLHQPEPLSQL